MIVVSLRVSFGHQQIKMTLRTVSPRQVYQPKAVLLLLEPITSHASSSYFTWLQKIDHFHIYNSH